MIVVALILGLDVCVYFVTILLVTYLFDLGWVLWFWFVWLFVSYVIVGIGCVGWVVAVVTTLLDFDCLF